MSKKIILIDRKDLHHTINEQRYNFVVSVLQSCGITEEELKECFPVEGFDSFSVDYRIKLKKICAKYTIDIIDDKDGGSKIYINNESLIAEWKKSRSVLRHDHLAIDPQKRLYMEVHLDWWTIFENENTTEK